jgi:hypothetical protein
LKNRIIYIIGAGRSGTTLLDIILGNAPNIFSVGELNRFTKRNGIPHDARDENADIFWRQINKTLEVKGCHHPGWYYKFSKKFEYHNSFLHTISQPNNADYKIYADYQQSLFDALHNKATSDYNKNILLDSSKYPLRAFFLSKIFGQSISFIYIKRNPFSTIESFQKKDVEQPSKSRIAANIYLLGVNSLARYILKKLRHTNKISIINYEELLSAPKIVLQKIEKDLTLDLSIPIQLIEGNLPLQVGNLFDGNRLRLEKEVLFKKTSLPVIPEGKNIDKLFYLLHKTVWHYN